MHGSTIFRYLLLISIYQVQGHRHFWLFDHDHRDTLQLVHVIFRHGDRTNEKLAIYPNDPHANVTYHPYGLGQLTNLGKQQMFELGRELRQKYANFLDDLYLPNTVDAWTSDTDRTKASLLTVLAGLFPPRVEDSLDDRHLIWQPIPYNYVPAKDDQLFNGALTPNFRQSLEGYLKGSTEALKDLVQQRDIFAFLSKHTGWKITNYERAYYLYLCLKTEENWGLKLPEWTHKVWPDKLEEMVHKLYISATANNLLRQQTSGKLLQKIVEDTKTKLNGTLPNRKIHLYSGHDFNIAFLLNTLDIYKPHIPPYGAYLIFEVHKIDKVYGIRILYKSNKNDEPQVLKLQKCNKFCDLVTFTEITQKYFTT